MNDEILRLSRKSENVTNIFALEVLEGLSKNPKGLPARFFYDENGSRIFQRITDLYEYYPTACEFEIFRDHREKIARRMEGAPFNLVELGCGDARKSILLLEAFQKTGLEFRYVPLDISETAIRSGIQNVRKNLPSANIPIKGLVGEYFEGLNWLAEGDHQRNLVIFLGSNIGNFSAAGARRFLRQLWYALNPDDHMLVGFDLKKDPKILHAAYNDLHGVTAEFNLNLLSRINRELGGEFDLNHFTHQGHYSVQSGAMESYLISTRQQKVRIGALDKEFEFAPWEGIHTEYSYKYLESDIEKLAADSGFEVLENLYDSRKYFVDSLWKVRKD